MTTRQESQHLAVVLERDRPQVPVPQRDDRRGSRVVGIVLSLWPESNNRARADNAAGTSTTVSPDATSCCANNAPCPVAPSTAHTRGANGAAQRNNRSRCRRSAGTDSSPTSFSSRSITAAVCDPLWGSIPMMNTKGLLASKLECRGGHS
jgi:hypothetical protein